MWTKPEIVRHLIFRSDRSNPPFRDSLNRSLPASIHRQLGISSRQEMQLQIQERQICDKTRILGPAGECGSRRMGKYRKTKYPTNLIISRTIRRHPSRRFLPARPPFAQRNEHRMRKLQYAPAVFIKFLAIR